MKIQNLFRPDLRDIQASFVVFLVSVPLCLGIALASDAPVHSGLVSGIIAGLVIGFLGPSQLSVSGPAAGLTVIVASGIAALHSFEAFCFATAIAGLLQVLLSQMRFGLLASFIPSSVIKGMLAAIGIIIVLKQIPHLFGVDVDAFGEMAFLQKDGENTFSEIANALTHLNMGALIVSVMSIGLMILWPRLGKKISFFQFIPAALLVVLCGIAINQFLLPVLNLTLSQEHLVTVPTDKGLFNPINVDYWGLLVSYEFWMTTVTVCLVASIESLLSLDATEKIDPLKRGVDPNKELLAQGIANTLCGALGGLPITAVIVRSSANISAGAVSKLSTILHGVWLLLFVVLVPALLNMIPFSSLAVILVFVGLKLTTPKLYKSYLKLGYKQWAPFLVTIGAILFTDLLVGICIGFLVGILFVVINSFSSAFVIVNNDNDYLLRFNKDTSFLNKPKLKKVLREIPNGSALIIDGTRAVLIDHDIIDMLDDFIESAPQKKIEVEVHRSNSAITPYFKLVSS
jgi:MFS superfamily sulfate permease-like transporter